MRRAGAGSAAYDGIRCRGIVKSFGTGMARSRVLHGIDLDIAAGQFTVLLGPSGCGKTTFISILAGLLSTDEGSVELFGTSLGGLGPKQAAAFRSRFVGFIFQQHNLLPALTALENASLPLLILKAGRRQAQDRAAETLTRLGLGAHLGKRPADLSGGQQQRVAVARALVHEPSLIICDEPTASLDAQSGALVTSLLRDIALRADRVVLAVTHDTRVLPLADRVVSIADGRIENDTLQRMVA